MYDIKIYKEADECRKIAWISVGIIILFSWLIYKEFKFMTIDYRNSDLLLNMCNIFVSGIVITFLVIFLIKLSNKVLIKDPFLIFEDNEIISKGLIGNITIKWKDVKSYKEISYLGKPSIILILDIENNEKISVMRGGIYKLNKLITGGEWMFTKSFLAEQYSEVVELIKEKVENNII